MRNPIVALPPQFSIIVEKNGVPISRDVLSAIDAARAKTIFLSLTEARYFDPADRTLNCRVERLAI